MIRSVIIRYGLLLLMSAPLCLWFGTQFVAWWFGYDASLGRPIVVWNDTAIYWPWQIVSWWRWWHHDVPEVKWGFGVAVASLALIVWSAWERVSGDLSSGKQIGNEPEWGTEDDLREHGLLRGSGYGELGGMVLGMLSNGKLITDGGDTHRFVKGDSGSGKTAGVVSPSIASYRGSMIVTDSKRELWDTWGEYRMKLGDAFFYDPTHPDTARKNFLDEIRVRTQYETGDINKVCDVLSRASGKPLTSDAARHYDSLGRELLRGLLLHVIHDKNCEDFSFPGVLKLLSRFVTETLPAMLSSRNAEVHDIANNFIAAAGTGPSSQSVARDLAGAIRSVNSVLDVFRDPFIAERSKTSDFKFSDLVCGEKPMSLFFQVRRSEAARLMPLVALFNMMFMNAMLHDEKVMPDGRRKRHRLGWILEEFPAQGKQLVITDNLKIMRSYGVTAMIVTQSIKELNLVYGPENSIVSNCKTAVCFSSLDKDEQAFVSDNAGPKEIERETVTHDYNWFMREPGKKVSTRDDRRPLLDRAAVRGLPKDKEVIFVSGCERPFLVSKVVWYKHPVFRRLGRNMFRPGAQPLGQSEMILRKQSKAKESCGEQV